MGLSAIYEGRVWHHRSTPRSHRFSRPLWMPCLDLGELDDVVGRSRLWSRRPAPVWFRRGDHLAPHDQPLDDAARDAAARALGRRPSGPVVMLGHLRTFGWCFNPLTLYWCFADGGDDVDAVVADVHNTPWNERRAYALAPERGPDGRLVAEFSKQLHVSPFLGMSHRYRLRCDSPGGERLRVRIQVIDERDDVVLDTGMHLRRHAMEPAQMRRVLWQHPMLTARVSAAIHIEALALWRKRVPVHRHPAREVVA